MAIQANNVVQLSEVIKERDTRATSSENISIDETTGLSLEQGLKHSDVDLFLGLLETLKKIPDHLVDAVSTLFKSLVEPKQELATDEILPIGIEELPVVSADLHTSNLSCLDELRMINPETENDIITTTLE